MKTKKIRCQIFLEPGSIEKLGMLSQRPGTTKGDVVAKAIEALIERRNTAEFDQQYIKRLDRITRDVGKARRDIEMTLESLALFIRYNISHDAHLPLPDKAAYAIAQKRYLKFVDDVGHQLAYSRKVSEGEEEKEGA
ncbi:MAG: hypothetical protein WC521_02355 [Bdellovibrionales bacterium]